MLGTAGCAQVVTGRAMGTTFRVLVHDGPADLGRRAAERIADLEQRWSRFLPGSEISGLNWSHGTTNVSADTTRLVTAMLAGWHATGGAYDPTLVAAMVRLGYAGSRDDPARRTDLPQSTLARGRPDLIRVDADGGAITMPPGTALDPGGIGKGLAADLVVAELLAQGARSALVEIGGDLAVAGTPPEGAWSIALGEPPAGQSPVRLLRGGVATSTSSRRRWSVGAHQLHHLLDPATGEPTAGDVATVTVVAGSATTAEVFTKLPFVRGAAVGLAALAAHGLAAAITATDGTTSATPAWKDFVQ